MEHGFWHDRWESNQIGFHQPEVNRLLADHLGALGLADGARIFLPLCGKTLDIAWLRHRGYRVAGAELSEIAIAQLFEDSGHVPDIAAHGPLKHYGAAGLDVFVGDIFDLDAATLGPVDAVYDRAALVALPAGMRARYVEHVARITGQAPQLLVTFEYDQTLMDGPPFSLSADEVTRLCSGAFRVTHLETRPLAGKLKGICPADETIWLLR